MPVRTGSRAEYKLGYDDSLDVVGVHLVGGLIGTLMIGLVAAPESYNGVAGLFFGGGFDQLWRQAVGAGAVLVYCAIATTILAYIVKFTVGLQATATKMRLPVPIRANMRKAATTSRLPAAARFWDVTAERNKGI